MPDDSNNGRELFEQVLAGTLRAVADDKDLEVSFTSDTPGLTPSGARISHLPYSFDLETITNLRGEADSIALKHRFHDPDLHRKLSPNGEKGQAIFNAVEQARYECMGALRMPGVGANLKKLGLKRATENGLTRRAGDLAFEDIAAPALAELVREKLLGEAPNLDLGEAYTQARIRLDELCGHMLDMLVDRREDQTKTAIITRAIVEELVGESAGDRREEEQMQNMPDEQDGEEAEDESEGDDDGESEAGDSDEVSGEADPDSTIEGDDEMSDAAEADGLMEGESSLEGMMPYRPNNPLSQMPESIIYNVYTQEFDETIRAEELCDPEELTRLRKYLDQQMAHLSGAVSKLANRLQRRLMAQQQRSWNFDLEEGMLDAGRLTRVIINPMNPLSYKMESDTDFRDTVVTLLIDNSGSMRGRPISIAAICADILARTLERCGVKVEILGFTTKAWKGGQSREKWLQSGRPQNPGRLNDLRHIIYKTADAPWRRASKNLGLMMREGLLKENIDGEGLLWAHNRLMGRSEDRRILMVISDGAPVDDSTQGVNSAVYLEQHLRQVITWIETRSPVELLAIGIGHDVTRYYSKAVTILDAEQLAGAMVEQLADLFDEKKKTTMQRSTKR
jgi:cobaltochelatase CobT